MSISKMVDECHPNQCPEGNQAFTIRDVGFLSISREHNDQSCLKNRPLSLPSFR
jgi:hypothetical protein